MTMDKKNLFWGISFLMLIGAIVQKSFFGGEFSAGLIILAVVSAYCGYKHTSN